MYEHMYMCSFFNVKKNGCFKNREFDLECDLVGEPNAWCLSGQFL